MIDVRHVQFRTIDQEKCAEVTVIVYKMCSVE